MTGADFRRIALSMPEAVEGAHFGNPDFRVGGKIFATLALEKRALAFSSSRRSNSPEWWRMPRNCSLRSPADGAARVPPASSSPKFLPPSWKPPCAPHGVNAHPNASRRTEGVASRGIFT